jgi:hypothetical protein
MSQRSFSRELIEKPLEESQTSEANSGRMYDQTRSAAARAAQRLRDNQRQRANWDVDGRIKQAIDALAETMDGHYQADCRKRRQTAVPQSDLVDLLLTYGLMAYAAEEFEFRDLYQPSFAPSLYRWRLDVDKVLKRDAIRDTLAQITRKAAEIRRK